MTASMAWKPACLQVHELQSFPRFSLLLLEEAFRPGELWVHRLPQPEISVGICLCCTIWDREEGERGQIQVRVEVVYRLANVSYSSHRGRVSLQLQGRWLAGFLLSAEFYSGITRWFSTGLPLLLLKRQQIQTRWIKKSKAWDSYAFSEYTLRKHGSMYVNDRVRYSEFCFLPAVISILESVFRHCR